MNFDFKQNTDGDLARQKSNNLSRCHLWVVLVHHHKTTPRDLSFNSFKQHCDSSLQKHTKTGMSSVNYDRVAVLKTMVNSVAQPCM